MTAGDACSKLRAFTGTATQISGGAVEGLNNKAKLTTKKAYGFRSYRCLEIALYHTLGNLPEPEVTHRFC